MSERKKIAIVTGASSGMGRAFVQQIMDKYRRLDEIWVIARHLQKERCGRNVLGQRLCFCRWIFCRKHSRSG
ncbi:MAG: hypothetical protein ACLTTO_07725 [Lachnospiraceae bacterium]